MMPIIMISQLISLLLSLSLLSTSVAFNITEVLAKNPDYSEFNKYLTETNVAGDVNSRKSITVLVVANKAMGSLSGKPKDVQRKIMSVHVVLEFYDDEKIKKLPTKTALLTTLFQTSGQAFDMQGFLNVTNHPMPSNLHADPNQNNKIENTMVTICSRVPGSKPDITLLRQVASEPYDFSVLEISELIIPPGIDASQPPPTWSPLAPVPAGSLAPSSGVVPINKTAMAPAPRATNNGSTAPTATPPDAGKNATAAPGSPPTPAAGPVGNAPSTAATVPAADAPDGSSAGRIPVALRVCVFLTMVSLVWMI
ncbi:hypothetical protein NMG60_11028790 [Bertholletia excelsa]